MHRLIIEARVNEYASRRNNPNVPWTPEEIARDAAACRAAGAGIVHFHARNADGSPNHAMAEYADTIARVRAVSDILIHPTLGAFTLDAPAETRIAHVIGTTGLGAEDEAKIKAAARHAPIVKSGNMSLGVNLLAALVRQAAKALDPDYDVEVLEMHHRSKVDAPSGTALLLGRAAAEGRGIDLETHSVRGRDGITGARRRGDIGFATLRGGSVVGEHSVIFAGDGETIEFTHRATDRVLFARGAVKAALWARDRKPGLYSMADVLGF